MGGVFGGRRHIRAAGSLREVLSETRAVDHHAHGILRDPPRTIDEFRGLFSESPDPRQWRHVASTASYLRAIDVLAGHLGCDATEDAVHERRLGTDPARYASSMLEASATEMVLIDEGFPTGEAAIGWRELAQITGCETRPVMRIEQVAEVALQALDAGPEALEMGAPSLDTTQRALEAVRAAVAGSRASGYVALKTIVAYRGGLDLDALGDPGRSDLDRSGGTDRLAGPALRRILIAALEANEETGDPLPVQVHTGFGDPDLLLPAARPGYLKPLIERFRDTTFVLLHCYPFIREAGWLASVYANVYFDISLTIPHVSRPAAALAEALELAPFSKLLYASDAARTPELYLLASVLWREALAEVLPAMLSERAAASAARRILRENAIDTYRIERGSRPA